MINRSIFDIVRQNYSDKDFGDKTKIALLEESLKAGDSLLETDKYDVSILHEACLNSGAILLQWLLEKCPNLIDARTNRGTNVLFYAAKYNNLAAVNFLLKHGKPELITQTNYSSITINYFAAVSFNIELFKDLSSRRGDTCFSVKDHKQYLNQALCDAAEYGSLSMVTYLIEQHHADPMYFIGNWVPLHHAATAGHTEIIRYLLNRNKINLNVSTNDEWGELPLDRAAVCGRLDAVKLLIEEYKANYLTPNKKGAYPLHAAAEYGHFDVVNYLLTKPDMQVDVLQQNEWGWSALFLAVSRNHISPVQKLVETHHANYIKPDKKGHSIIHIAAMNGHVDMLRYFLDPIYSPIQLAEFENDQSFEPLMKLAIQPPRLSDANIQVNDDGDIKTPLCYAAENGHLGAVKYLVEIQRAEMLKGSTPPLHWAARRGHTAIVSYLIESKTNVDAQDFRQRTALFLAAGWGRLETVITLIEKHQANYLHSFGENRLPLMNAVSSGHTDVLAYFINQKRMDINTTDSSSTALHCAAENNQLSTVLWLKKQGASQTIKDPFNRTPLERSLNPYVNLECFIALYHVSFFISNKSSGSLSSISSKNKNQILRCALANDDSPDLLLLNLLPEFSIRDDKYVEICGVSKAESVDIAKQQRLFMKNKSVDYLEVFSIEKSLSFLTVCYLVEKNFFKKLSIDLNNYILRFLLNYPLKTLPSTIMATMREKSNSRLSFWSKLNNPSSMPHDLQPNEKPGVKCYRTV